LLAVAKAQSPVLEGDAHEVNVRAKVVQEQQRRRGRASRPDDAVGKVRPIDVEEKGVCSLLGRHFGSFCSGSEGRSVCSLICEDDQGRCFDNSSPSDARTGCRSYTGLPPSMPATIGMRSPQGCLSYLAMLIPSLLIKVYPCTFFIPNRSLRSLISPLWLLDVISEAWELSDYSTGTIGTTPFLYITA
jgi:hypothetical protein